MTEAELCALFAAAAREDGWTVYPEVSEWDLVLVWNNPDGLPKSVHHYMRRDPSLLLRSGDCIAVEAKTRASTAALAQAYKRHLPPKTQARSRSGPDFKAVLVPKAPAAYGYCASFMDLSVFDYKHYEEVPGSDSPYVKGRRAIFPKPELRLTERWTGRMWLPPVIPDIEAGVPSPSALTSWRVGALKICALVRERGYVSLSDFKEFGLSMARWRNQGSKSWLVNSGEREGRSYRYVLADPLPDDFPDIGWETARDQIWAKHQEQEESDE